MHSASIIAAGLAAVAQAAVSVSGTPEGFAASVTGGGDAEAVYPTSTDELYVYIYISLSSLRGILASPSY